MIRLDARGRWRRAAAKKDDAEWTSSPIELQPADHEEPTWEMRSERLRWRRMDRRTRSLLAAAAAAAVVVNAGAAWAYWRISGSEVGQLSGGSIVELELRARSDLNRPLAPGGNGNLTIAVINDYDFPIRVTSIAPGTGNIVADDEHRELGCRVTGVEITRTGFEVSWDVPRNTIGAFTVDDALAMRADADPACRGAIFTVPVRVSAMSRKAP